MNPGYIDVAKSLVLVLVALAVTRYWKVPVQKEMSIGVVRAFIQLVAVGYALKYIFAIDSIWLISLALLIMLAVGAREASSRAKHLDKGFWIAFLSMTLGSILTLGIMLAIGLHKTTEENLPLAQFVIPLAGMLISNSMNAATLSINRLYDSLTENRLAVETALALGKSWREASRKYQRQAAVAGMVSILNFLKTVGIVALPGAMTGMILAGAEPIQAVLLQLIVGFMLLSAVSITSLTALEFTIRKFFTPNDQFQPPMKLLKAK